MRMRIQNKFFCFVFINKISGLKWVKVGLELFINSGPEVIFKLDKSMVKGNSVLNILDQLDEKRQEKFKPLTELEE